MATAKKPAAKKAPAKKAPAKKPAAKKAPAKKPAAKKAAPAKKAAAKKAPAKKAAAKKPAAPKKKRTPNAAFMRPMMPNAALAAIVGANPLARSEIVSKVWAYIKKFGLQDKINKRMVNTDAKLRELFGKAQFSMFEVGGMIGKNAK